LRLPHPSRDPTAASTRPRGITIECPRSRGNFTRITIADCDRRIAHYRAALDRGTDPELVSGWITQTQAEKAAAQRQLNETDQAQRTVLTETRSRI
ncbi:hypothetical protein ACFWAG_33185, partial [Streptomyces violascens]